MTDIAPTTEPDARTISEVERAAAEAIHQMAEDARRKIPTIEPTEDEDTESIEYVRTGWIHVKIDGTLYRLRPVTMGNLRKLRTSLEDLIEIQRGKVHATQVKIRALTAQGRELDAIAAADRTEENYYEPVFKLRGEIKRLNLALGDDADDTRVQWFLQVFETLSVGQDGKPSIPDELGAWAANADLPDKWITHWRTVPLGRG